MATDQLVDTFAVFRRTHAPTVFDLALRHSGDTGTAVACVDAVFSELAGRWHAVGDPLRFIRRAAVLFVYGPRRRARRWTHAGRRTRAQHSRALVLSAP